MSYLDQVERGKKQKPLFVLIYGSDGVGKSTFGADSPDPIFLCAESGTNHLDVNRLPEPKSFEDVLGMVDELLTTKHKFVSLVIDSLDWMEPLVWKQVCADGDKKNVEDFGYGKGYVLALGQWQKLIEKLKALREKMNIVLIAHAQVKTFQDPVLNSGYDRYQLKLNEKAASLFREAVDAVLFATYEVFTKKDGLKTRAFGEGARVIFTERRPGHDAKNRFGLPYQMALNWEEFTNVIESGIGDTTDQIKESIDGLLAQVKDQELKKKVKQTVEASANDPIKLRKIVDRLNLKLEGAAHG